MEHELIYKNIAVIGAGASGGFVSILLSKNPYNNITVFDFKEPFSTLLPTGGGRCNITNAEKDIKEFVKNYPRGEKFLLSVFSKFDQFKTRELFSDLGIKTYMQNDKRVFPLTDSSKRTIQTLLKHLDVSNVLIKKEKVNSVSKEGDIFTVTTENGGQYFFDSVIIATGGKGKGFDFARSFGHNIINPKPSLCALDIKEKNFYKLSGLSFKNAEVKIKSGKKNIICNGDVLFTHKSISGPCIFKISAICAYVDFSEQSPLELCFNFTGVSSEDIEKELKENSKKSIKNIFSKFAPESYVKEIMKMNGIDELKQAAQIKKTEKELLINSLIAQRLNAVKRLKDSEIVTAGGVDLKEINPQTMESKLVKNLYFIGEILDIDGFTGGFNLQNCWSGAYVCSTNF